MFPTSFLATVDRQVALGHTRPLRDMDVPTVQPTCHFPQYDSFFMLGRPNIPISHQRYSAMSPPQSYVIEGCRVNVSL